LRLDPPEAEVAHRLDVLRWPRSRGERLGALKDRLLTSPRFLRWASHFPLTRMVARARARALFDLCAGFVYSQVLFACVQLRLFEMLREGPQDLATLAQRLGIDRDATARLLSAASALQLTEARGPGRYGLGPLGAAVAANPGIAAMVEHHAHLYADLADPVALLRGERADTELSRYWPYAGASSPQALSGEQVAPYSALMALSLPMVAEEVVDAYDFGRHRVLLDVGGGEGAFLAAVAVEAPKLKLMLFDVPAVAERAKKALSANGLARLATVCGGDFLADSLPRGADLVTLIRVILDHDDANALCILRGARAALAADGTLLIAETMAETPGAEAMGGAYFGFYLMAMGRGRPRTREQLGALLQEAGFSKISFRRGRLLLRTGIVVARP
jgi:demethylspheroidene O-methyltransferase